MFDEGQTARCGARKTGLGARRFRLADRHAAIGGEDLTGDVARGVGGEEHEHRRDLARLGPAPERDAREILVAKARIGDTIGGILMALFMNNGGGAWDNAKKYIEAGYLKDENGKPLGKHTPAHDASVVGDTVGDPFKDTAGPSLHIVIKLFATITLVMAPLFLALHP